MPKLVLKFENETLRERLVGDTPVTIGRAPHNLLVIDNPAVSHFHARVSNANGRLLLEDCDSLNGTYVNGHRVKSIILKWGDTIGIGKHKILVMPAMDTPAWGAQGDWKAPGPRVQETMLLSTALWSTFLQQAAAEGETSQVAPERVKVATLVVRKGRTTQREYLLSGQLAVIGRSKMATVRLNRWFAPKAAAQIHRSHDNFYYLGSADKVPTVNGYPAERPTKLLAGDVIEVAGVELEFVYRD